MTSAGQRGPRSELHAIPGTGQRGHQVRLPPGHAPICLRGGVCQVCERDGDTKERENETINGGRTRDTFKLLLLLLSHKRKRDTDTHTTVSFQKNNNKNGKNIYRDPQLRVNKTANCGYGCFDRTQVTKKRMQGPKFQRRSSSSSSPFISHLRNSRAFP